MAHKHGLTGGVEAESENSAALAKAVGHLPLVAEPAPTARATADEPCPDEPAPIDPLRGLRPADAPPTDLLVAGTVFFDMIFTGLSTPPRLGTEVFTAGLGSGPGGAANMAVAARRLGMRTALAAAFGEDVYGEYLWATLTEQEHLDLSPSRRFPGWATPVTVSMSYARDRSLVTYEESAPAPLDSIVGSPPRALACFAHLNGCSDDWVRRASAQGALVFAGVGWDPSEAWSPESLDRLDHCEALLANETEALRYTRTSDVAKAVGKLADHVPVAVVTCGKNGAYAVDHRTGETAFGAALQVEALDPTGAGDVFAAAFVLGTLAGWPLSHRLRFAGLAGALSVGHYGGSLGAPCWHDVANWRAGVRASTAPDDPLRAAFDFLDDLLPADIEPDVPRATPTIRLRVPAQRVP